MNLGANKDYENYIFDAANRRNIDPLGLAAAADLEAAKDRSGRWRPNSVNGNALGILQYKPGRWIDSATTPGFYLNDLGKRSGLVQKNNEPVPYHQHALLQLRLNPIVSFQTYADNTKSTVDYLLRHGVINGKPIPEREAWYGYIGHHEGNKGATQMLDRNDVLGLGGLGQRSAMTRLKANLDDARRDALLKKHNGDARAAYFDFVDNVLARRFNMDKFR